MSRRKRGLGRTYLNPAAAVNICRRRGNRTPGEIYGCALAALPEGPRSEIWAREAKRLARQYGQLDGAVKRRRRRRR